MYDLNSVAQILSEVMLSSARGAAGSGTAGRSPAKADEAKG
jgi:hypothetical protein